MKVYKCDICKEEIDNCTKVTVGIGGDYKSIDLCNNHLKEFEQLINDYFQFDEPINTRDNINNYPWDIMVDYLNMK